MLLPVADAERIVLACVPPLPAEDCPLAMAAGRVLREPVVADRDLPPFDRAMLDGIAVRHAAYAAGRRDFRGAGVQAAGMVRKSVADPADCLEIMTGAALPAGCDTVIPIEDLERTDDGFRVSAGAAVSPGQGVHRQGSDAPAGQELIPAGRRLSAREIGIAASAGRPTLRVALRPRVAVVATGDELVGVETDPAPHQIRRSNDLALRALLLAAGCGLADRFHLRDLEHEIEATLRRLIAEYDWLVLCGGVSKGKFDFVPAVLQRLRVEAEFAGVAQRPGKPFWFGVSPRHTPVFALPGNPVSALVTARRYLRPALDLALGADPEPVRRVAAASAFPVSPKLTVFTPAGLASADDGRLVATPAPTNTSGDFAGLTGTDGFVETPPGAAGAAGAVFRFWPWD